jgi:putative restriction endonuclease
MPDRPWTREEVLLTINLYCRLPYRKLRQSTPEVKELASLLNRTPSAISMRCCNYVQFDPVESKRVKGIVNAAKLDRAIWGEITKDWENFAVESDHLLEEFRNGTRVVNDDKSTEGVALVIPQQSKLPAGTTKQQTVLVRVGQQFFRTAVLTAYNHQCCVTGLHNDSLLIASHIKPWKDSDPKTERINPSNGLCLSPLYDKTFDIGLMTVDEQYRIIFAHKIHECATHETIDRFFKHYEGKQLNLPDRFFPDKTFLAYRRENIFQN